MKLTKTIGIVLSIASINAVVAHADMYSGLSAADQATINSGAQVTATQDVDGSAWPKVTVYQRVEATPDQVAAIMFDYALQKTMFAPKKDANGKVTVAGITASAAVTPGAANTNVDYMMTFPSVLGISLPDEVYTVNDVLSSPSAGTYQIAWTMVKASSMKDTQGVVAFERLGTGTLIGYTNFISPPKPFLAKLIVKTYVQMIQTTVSSLAAQAVSERGGDQGKLNAQLATLTQALGQ
jgi:hypothetical protein